MTEEIETNILMGLSLVLAVGFIVFGVAYEITKYKAAQIIVEGCNNDRRD